MSVALLEVQRRFLAALYDGDAPGPLDSIAGNGLEPTARLRIYRRSCDAIQAGALRTAYPAVLALVGETFFEQTARGYRTRFPSHAGNLQAFGDHFAAYLADVPSIHELAYVPEVARLEWLRQEVALAADGVASSHQIAVCRADPTSTRTEAILHPGVRLLASSYPVLTIWRYAMQPTSARLELSTAGERVMLWREEDQVAMSAFDPASFACIESLARGDTLADADQAGRLHDPDFDFAACTNSLADRGLLTMRAAHESQLET